MKKLLGLAPRTARRNAEDGSKGDVQLEQDMGATGQRSGETGGMHRAVAVRAEVEPAMTMTDATQHFQTSAR